VELFAGEVVRIEIDARIAVDLEVYERGSLMRCSVG
jgi:hypothetical protein